MDNVQEIEGLKIANEELPEKEAKSSLIHVLLR